MRTALLLIDMQKACLKGAFAEFYHPEQAAWKARIVLDAFRRDKLPVAYVQPENVRQNAAFFIQGIGGISFCDGAAPQADGHAVIKYALSDFAQTDLQIPLKQEGIESLVVCGMISHICINTMAGEARARGCGATFLYDTGIVKVLSTGLLGNCPAGYFVESVFFPDLSNFCHVFCWR